MSTLVIVLLVIAGVLGLLFAGGLVASRRRLRRQQQSGSYTRHLDAADRALEEARAADRGWDRELLDAAARRALAEQRPGRSFEALHVVLVDDRPGVHEDRAEMVAVGGEEGEETRLILARREAGWVVERVE